jgi:sporulation protein YabP
MELTGVSNVLTFDEEEIILQTNMGGLLILGDNLHITMLNLDEGKVAIQGNIGSIEYKAQGTDLKAKSKNVLSRLFK